MQFPSPRKKEISFKVNTRVTWTCTIVALTAHTAAGHTPLKMKWAPTRTLKSRFCVLSGTTWKLQDYAPLIDPKQGTRFVQAIGGETSTNRVVVKSFDRRTSLAYDYKFNQQGSLVAFHGVLHRWGHWIVDANLLPEGDGVFHERDANYRLSEDCPIIQRPEDSSDYTSVFRAAPVYRTMADVPCAKLFQAVDQQEKQ